MTELAPLPVAPPRRLVYFGTPQMAVAPLEALVAAGFEISLVVTRADKRRGRGAELAPSPVKAAAQRLGLPISHVVADALGAGADLGVVVAFGQLIKPGVLAALPMVNLHFSLLPRWRGAAPVERALLAGDTTTGVCLMQLEVGLDTGAILDRIEVPIGARQTADELRRVLVDVGTTQLVDNLRRGLVDGTPQVGEPTYASKLDPAEFAIDWTRPAVEIDRLVRLGVAWTWFRGKRLKIIETEAADSDGGSASGAFVAPSSVECWQSTLMLVRVQPEGKPAMAAGAWANGARPTSVDVFGVAPTAGSDAS
ncbi:MAG: fmt [Acidimicrobiales bacterium]|nr:fmt [Acidimicrobiales bacterium]